MSKLIIFLLLASLLMPGHVYAGTDFSAHALEWYLRKEGKYKPGCLMTRQIKGTDKYYISEWKVDGMPQPDEIQINSIIEEYNFKKVTAKDIEIRIEELEARVKSLEKL
jgi:hypothetical protein